MPCWKCVHQIEISGNCHIGCNNSSPKVELKTWPRCGVFPFNFDANIVRHCPNESNDPKNKKPLDDDPLMQLCRLLI